MQEAEAAKIFAVGLGVSIWSCFLLWVRVRVRKVILRVIIRLTLICSLLLSMPLSVGYLLVKKEGLDNSEGPLFSFLPFIIGLIPLAMGLMTAILYEQMLERKNRITPRAS